MRKFVVLFLAISLAVPMVNLSAVSAQNAVTYVRRAEAVMILLKNAGVEIDTNASTNGRYPDVLDGEWYVPYVIKGVDLDMIDVEYATGLLHPHRSVTRAEFLKMMTKAFGLTTNIPSQYIDIPDTAWYTPYVGLSWKYSLFEGDTANRLHPERRITHSEATRVIYTLLAAEPSLQPTANMFPVANKPVAEKQKGLLRSLLDALRPRAAQVNEQPRSGPMSDPDLVKHTVLTLIRSRGNQAEHTKNELITAINAVRARYNVGPVRSNYNLDLSAQRHAKDMAERGYFSHYTPEGLSYVDRIRGAGYMRVDPSHCQDCEPTFSVGENLAKGQLSVEQVMEDWLNSPNHRKNILRPQFDEIGIGLFGDLWVQNFGSITAP